MDAETFIREFVDVWNVLSSDDDTEFIINLYSMILGRKKELYTSFLELKDGLVQRGIIEIKQEFRGRKTDDEITSMTKKIEDFFLKLESRLNQT